MTHKQATRLDAIECPIQRGDYYAVLYSGKVSVVMVDSDKVPQATSEVMVDSGGNVAAAIEQGVRLINEQWKRKEAAHLATGIDVMIDPRTPIVVEEQ